MPLKFCSVPNKGRYLRRGKKPFEERFFFPSSNSTPFFQTFYWHLFFAAQKTNVLKILRKQLPNYRFFYLPILGTELKILEKQLSNADYFYLPLLGTELSENSENSKDCCKCIVYSSLFCCSYLFQVLFIRAVKGLYLLWAIPRLLQIWRRNNHIAFLFCFPAAAISMVSGNQNFSGNKKEQEIHADLSYCYSLA